METVIVKLLKDIESECAERRSAIKNVIKSILKSTTKELQNIINKSSPGETFQKVLVIRFKYMLQRWTHKTDQANMSNHHLA